VSRGASRKSVAANRGHQWAKFTPDVLAERCPSRAVLNDVTSRWGVLVLLALRDGKRRFSELRGLIGGISEKMLAQTLQRLETDGFVERFAHAVVPPHVEYRLSPLGVGIAQRIAALTDWIEGRLPQILVARERANRRRNDPRG
jgi:DNA-binding HxlR family transcriptional regulator